MDAVSAGHFTYWWFFCTQNSDFEIQIKGFKHDGNTNSSSNYSAITGIAGDSGKA
ncbi:hypothetical protein PAC01_13080 [Pediococcus acidilactici]|nr:hypothetical protein PAC01_13080 [Pediococcus acidilactici]